MRKPATLFAAAFLLLALATLKGWSESDFEDVTLEIEGMTCGSCASSIDSALEKVDGVASAETDFPSRRARVRFDGAVASTGDLVQAVEALGYGARVRPASAEALETDAGAGASCSTVPVPEGNATATTLSADEMSRVVDYILDQIDASGRTGFESSEIQEATGVEVKDSDQRALQAAVLARLRGTDLGRKLLAGNRCQAYEACSLYGDLSGADGDVLAMYEREKAEDGRLFDDFRLPEFAAHDLAGGDVSSADLVGRPALLALVAVHCRHSMDSLPILQKLTETYGPKGLRVVAVAINSGTVEDVNTWFPSFKPKYDVWVSTGDALGDAIRSHLVPTYLFVDAEGNITEKLVGFKEESAVTERVLTRLAAASREDLTEIASR